MSGADLEQVARALVAPAKGILAADESSGTIKKRFDSIGVESNETNRRDYREMLFTTKGAADNISGVILYDETIRQKSSDGTMLVDILERQGIIPGIKVDLGAKTLAGSPDEKVTEGLDGLRERLVEYRGLGAKFAKWRAVITIGEGIPTEYCLDVNAHALARYAALCQDEGIVPIVEPEVLMDGKHSIERCYQVTSDTLHTVFGQLYEQRVSLEGMLLKPNMVLPGKDERTAPPEEVAAATVKCFREVVPAAVPGIVFLSGGQGDEEATANLNAMNAIGPHPWQLSFSYGRALQAPALKAWKGAKANFEAGQRAYLHRATCNGRARACRRRGRGRDRVRTVRARRRHPRRRRDARREARRQGVEPPGVRRRRRPDEPPGRRRRRAGPRREPVHPLRRHSPGPAALLRRGGAPGDRRAAGRGVLGRARGPRGPGRLRALPGPDGPRAGQRRAGHPAGRDLRPAPEDLPALVRGGSGVHADGGPRVPGRPGEYGPRAGTLGRSGRIGPSG
jgi:fructose-bisphosphate aldolase class I